MSVKQTNLIDYNQDVKIPLWKFRIGYDGELQAYTEFQNCIANLPRWIRKHNPFNCFEEWIKRRGKGCDFIFKIGHKIIKIEVSTMSHPYQFSIERYLPSRVERLNNLEYTNGNKYNGVIKIWVVVGLEYMTNYSAVKRWAEKEFAIRLMSLSQAVAYLLSSISAITAHQASSNTALKDNIPLISTTNNSIVTTNSKQDSNKKGEFSDLNPDKNKEIWVNGVRSW